MTRDNAGGGCVRGLSALGGVSGRAAAERDFAQAKRLGYKPQRETLGADRMATGGTGIGRRLRLASLLLVIVVVVGLSCDGPVSERHIGTAPAASREHAIERTPIRSSAMRSVGYAQEQRVLEIEFTGGEVYRYFDVPPEVYSGLMAAESHGRYFHQHIRNKSYRYQRMN